MIRLLKANVRTLRKGVQLRLVGNSFLKPTESAEGDGAEGKTDSESCCRKV